MNPFISSFVLGKGGGEIVWNYAPAENYFLELPQITVIRTTFFTASALCRDAPRADGQSGRRERTSQSHSKSRDAPGNLA